jgi:hypothetical protein
MKKFLLSILILFFMAVNANAVIYFEQNFNNATDWDYTDWDPNYNFSSCKFGYTDNKIQNSTNNNVIGGYSGRCHQIPIFGMTGTQTNFDIHFQKDISPVRSAYYIRFYLKISSNFNTDPAANWKFTYNYYNESDNFVFWFRPMEDGEGFQPAFYSAVEDFDLTKTEAVSTFYWANYKNQWVCFEYYVNHSTNALKLWITTPDHLGDYNETLYINATYDMGGSSTNSIKWGAYWDGTEQQDNYIWIDEIVMSDTYIGPMGGGEVLPIVKGLTIQGGTIQ